MQRIPYKVSASTQTVERDKVQLLHHTAGVRIKTGVKKKDVALKIKQP